MRPRIILPAILVLGTVGLAGAESGDLVATALGATSPSGADGVLVLDEKEVTLEKDGRVLVRTRQVQRILTDEGLDAYGDPPILYNRDHQDVDVKTARTTRQDGESTGITPNALNVITPAGVAGAVWYSDMQEMVVTFLGLEVGSVTELETTVEDRKPFRKLLYGSEPLHDERDVRKKVLAVRIPSDKELAWFSTGTPVDPEVSESNGIKEYRFRFDDLPSTSQHEAAGPSAPAAPVLYWMERTGTRKLASRLLAASPYAMGKDDAVEQADAILTTLREETAEETWNPVQEALGFHRRVAEDMATVHVERSIFGDRVRKPLKAFKSGYADPIEKLGILHTIYSRLGYDPVPIVTLHHDPGGTRRLHPHNIKGLWLRISVQGRILYLDATATETEGEPRDRHVFVISTDGMERASFVKPATTRMRFEAVADLTAEEPLIVGTLTLRGGFNPYWGIFTSGGGSAVDVVSSVMGENAGMEVTQASFIRLALDESTLSFTARPAVVDGLVDITLPSLLAPLLTEWEPWRSERDLPLPLVEKKWEKVRLEVRLPDGARVLYSPDFNETTRDSGPVSIFHSKGLDAQHVSLARRVTMLPGTITAKDMVDALDVLADALGRNRNRVVVQMPTGEGP